MNAITKWFHRSCHWSSEPTLFGKQMLCNSSSPKQTLALTCNYLPICTCFPCDIACPQEIWRLERPNELNLSSFYGLPHEIVLSTSCASIQASFPCFQQILSCADSSVPPLMNRIPRDAFPSSCESYKVHLDCCHVSCFAWRGLFGSVLGTKGQFLYFVQPITFPSCFQ